MIMSKIDKNYWPFILDNSTVLEYFKGDKVFQKGSKPQWLMFIVLRGEVSFQTEVGEDNGHSGLDLVDFVRIRSYFGEFEWGDKDKRIWGCRTRKKSRILAIGNLDVENKERINYLKKILKKGIIKYWRAQRLGEFRKYESETKDSVKKFFQECIERH